MSYCRFSSDNWRCEVYCYGDASGGYTTHVASNRVVGDIPQDPSWTELDDDSYNLVGPRPRFDARRHRAVLDFLENAERTPIGLSSDGETFNDPDLPSFLVRLESLKAEGYNVPQFVIDDVRDEIATEGGP